MSLDVSKRAGRRIHRDAILVILDDVRRDASLGRPAKLFFHEMRHQIQSYALQMRRFSQRLNVSAPSNTCAPTSVKSA